MRHKEEYDKLKKVRPVIVSRMELIAKKGIIDPERIIGRSDPV